jgi:uncharacterized iron-regulated membrane protein
MVGGTVPHGAFDSVEVLVRAKDGAVLRTGEGNPSAYGTATRVLYGLHFARYGGMYIRVLYTLLALAGCLTMLTGNWVWLTRREKTRAHPGNRLLRRLTIGFGAGLCVATASVLVANRVLPRELHDRADTEKWIFAAVFVAALVWALAAREVTLWWRQLGLTGALCVATPIAGVIATRGAVWRGGSPVLATVASVDGMILAIGVGLLALARFLRRRASRGGL